MKFSEVIGQQDVKNRLMQMVAEHRVPHALLFCGPEGCGKMAMALAFASYLLVPPPCFANGNIPTCISPILLLNLPAWATIHP